MPMSLTLDRVLADLVAGDFQQRWEAVKQLPIFGTEAIAPLLNLLVEAEDTEDEALQWFIVRSLGEYRQPEVIAVLIDILTRASDPDLHDAATMALTQFGEASIEAILPLLQHLERRDQAVQILACLQTARVVPPLLSVVGDRDPKVRARAIAALGQFRSPEIIFALLNALSDPVVAVRREAVIALGRDRDRLKAVDGTTRLAQCLWDPDITVGQATATALGRLGMVDTIPHLAQVLRSPQPPEALKLCAVRSLGWMHQSPALTVLISTWDNGSEAVRLAIVEALGQCSTPQLKARSRQCCREWLTGVLPNPRAKALKQALALTLGRWHDHESVALIQQLLRDSDPQVQAHGAAALRLIGSATTANPMKSPSAPLAAIDTKM